MGKRRQSKKTTQQDQKNPAAIVIKACGPDDVDAATARTLMRPTVHAAATIYEYESLKKHGSDVNAFVDELVKQVEAVNGGDLKRAESMLVSQAHTLDEIFNNLARRANRNITAGYLHTAETFLRLALRAQSQCRATLETLALIKNPQPVAFVRQANIAAGPQQVNNGVPSPATSRAGENEIEQNKLLEHQHGERVDCGAASAASSANTQMATVGKIHWAENP